MTKIKIIGFDLDGTLYKATPEIERIQKRKIYEKISDFFNINIETAERLFESNYRELNSGTRTLERIAKKCGKPLTNPDFIQEALREANFLRFIQPDRKLIGLFERLSRKYPEGLDLLTGSKYDLTIKKLKKLGINPSSFKVLLTDEDGSKISGNLYDKWIEMRKSLGGFSPKSFLYVGDNIRSDIISPSRFGIQTCYLGKSKKANYSIQTIFDLEKIV